MLQSVEFQIVGHDLGLNNSNSKYSSMPLQWSSMLLRKYISGENLYGEELTLEHSLNHPQRMVYVVLYILCGLAISLIWSKFLKHLDKFLSL